MKAYKWAYNPEAKELDVWEVDNDKIHARPQHGERLSTEQYASFYQGRLVMDKDGPVSFVIYGDRPFENRSEELADEARSALREWIASYDYNL